MLATCYSFLTPNSGNAICLLSQVVDTTVWMGPLDKAEQVQPTPTGCKTVDPALKRMDPEQDAVEETIRVSAEAPITRDSANLPWEDGGVEPRDLMNLHRLPSVAEVGLRVIAGGVLQMIYKAFYTSIFFQEREGTAEVSVPSADDKPREMPSRAEKLSRPSSAKRMVHRSDSMPKNRPGSAGLSSADRPLNDSKGARNAVSR